MIPVRLLKHTQDLQNADDDDDNVDMDKKEEISYFLRKEKEVILDYSPMLLTDWNWHILVSSGQNYYRV